jgi:predicted TIM-barrel fold metal-dependent hydrolase
MTTEAASQDRTLVIDAHAHMLPSGARALLAKATGGGPRLATLRSLPDDSPMLQVDERLTEMDRLGIDVAVLALPPVGLLADHGLVQDLMIAANSGLVEVSDRHPDRFVVLASLAVPDGIAALAEIDRLAGQPAVRGITFPAQATLHRPDQIGLEPVFARAASLGWPCLIHPSGASAALNDAFEDFGLALAMHSMVSGPLAVARMIAAGFFDRIPDLAVIVPNLGGILPFITPRLDDRVSGSLLRRPSEYLRSNVFYDSSSMPAGPAFRCTIEEVGVGQILFGTDYPSWPMSTALEAVDAMRLGDSDRSAILGDTAARWFDPARVQRGALA